MYNIVLLQFVENWHIKVDWYKVFKWCQKRCRKTCRKTCQKLTWFRPIVTWSTGLLNKIVTCAWRTSHGVPVKCIFIHIHSPFNKFSTTDQPCGQKYCLNLFRHKKWRSNQQPIKYLIQGVQVESLRYGVEWLILVGHPVCKQVDVCLDLKRCFNSIYYIN